MVPSASEFRSFDASSDQAMLEKANRVKSNMKIVFFTIGANYICRYIFFANDQAHARLQNSDGCFHGTGTTGHESIAMFCFFGLKYSRAYSRSLSTS